MELLYSLGPSQLGSHHVLFLRNLIPSELPGGMSTKLTEQFGGFCKKLIITNISSILVQVEPVGPHMMRFDACVQYAKI